MKKATWVFVLIGSLAMPVWADGYGGLAVGLGEVCDGVGGASFTDDECRNPGVSLRGYMGNALNDFVRIEVSIDTLFDPRRLFGSHGNTHVTAVTLGGYALANLPLTRDVNLFAGPGVGASMVHVTWDYRRYYDSQMQETYEDSSSDTSFGLNYGWTVGAEFVTDDNAVLRVQWQTWNSMDSDVLFDKEFSANYLSLSLRRGF